MTQNCVSNQLSLVPYVNRVATIGTSYVPHLLCHKTMIVVTGDENCQLSGDNKISKKKTADTINILKNRMLQSLLYCSSNSNNRGSLSTSVVC